MNICEGCIKQDVCKFKEWGDKTRLDTDCSCYPDYIVETLTCKYKEIRPESVPNVIPYYPQYPYPPYPWPWEPTAVPWTITYTCGSPY